MRPAFLRPIEVGSGPHVTVECAGGGGASAVSIDAGVYSSFEAAALALLVAVNAELDGSWSDGDITMSLSSDYLISWHNVGAAGTISWTWSDTTLRDDLGFDDDFSFTAIISSVEATYRPLHLWLPPYEHSDQGRWYCPQGDLFSGATSQDGALVGTTGNPRLWFRDFAFPHVPAAELLYSAGSSKAETERCLEEFSRLVRTAVPSAATSPRMAAVWCVHDYASLVQTYTTASSAVISDAGSVLTGSATHVFCCAPPGGFAAVGDQPSLPTGSTRYNCAINLNTAIDSCPTYQDFA